MTNTRMSTVDYKIHHLVKKLLRGTSCGILNKSNAIVYALAYQAQWAS